MAKRKSEADLEARMHAVMANLTAVAARGRSRHQTRFTVRLGHAVVEIDGRNGRRVDGRADMIVCARQSPGGLRTEAPGPCPDRRRHDTGSLVLLDSRRQ